MLTNRVIAIEEAKKYNWKMSKEKMNKKQVKKYKETKGKWWHNKQFKRRKKEGFKRRKKEGNNRERYKAN